MKINEFRDETLGEVVYTAKHSSGLEIRLMPKENYDSVFALFSVNYGSIDTHVQQKNGSFKAIPEGTAHFLEHKLFESEELDAFELFQRTGAYANAFTSFDRTAYLFKGSERTEESLGYLLDFVQKPYFTAETVQKEQGIIGQEIRMYKDLPDWEVFFNLLSILYPKHPVSIDIAGTQESIAKIDDKLLYKLYETFYNPSNMCITLVGKMDKDAVFKQIDKSIIRKKQPVPERKFDPKTPKSKQKYIEERLAVGRKQFCLGIREEIDKPELSLEDEYASGILLDILFGKDSDFFRKIVDEGLTTMEFSGSLFNGYGYSAYLISGPGEDPEKLADLIKKEIAKAQKTGVSKEEFERAKRKYYGYAVRGYDDINGMANTLTALYYSGYKPFDDINAIKKITLARVNKRLKSINVKDAALSVILPAE
ncbi:MAG: insulinase family protein [Clostridia bacterium]|nr:insulinase family protein [Clostridia bacterium]